MSNISVPIARTDLTEEEIKAVLEPLESGWLVQGPQVASFQDKWSAFTGAPNSIAVTSCTSALHLSLAALGFGPGDEAIIPAFTWISTANVVEHLGGRVVFCDIDLNNFIIFQLCNGGVGLLQPYFHHLGIQNKGMKEKEIQQFP